MSRESSKIRYLRRIADFEFSCVFKGLAYPCNKVLWRDQVRRGVLVAEPPPVFTPVRVVADPPAPAPDGAAAPARPAPPRRVEAAAVDGRIEIALPDGTVIRVGEEVGLAALRRVVAALRA